MLYHVFSLSITVLFAALHYSHMTFGLLDLNLNLFSSLFFFFGLPLSDSTARQSLTRPKSFVSTRLLSLEEAQARTQAPLLLQGSPHHAIGQFHTVLDLPADKWVSFHKSVTYKGMVNLQIKFFTFKYFKYFFLFLLGGKEG